MASVQEFCKVLTQLVADMPRVEAELRASPFGKLTAKPEAVTEDRLLKPLLDALGFDKDHRTPQTAIRNSLNDRTGWVDFRLNGSPTDRKGLALLEAKPLLETRDLWVTYRKQTRGYLRDYQLALKEAEPVRWMVLTNFRELHVLNIADHEPFLKLTANQYIENAELIFRLLSREQMLNDQITSIYHEKRRVPLGKSFLRDLKLWRLLIANGLKVSQSHLTLEQAKALSQQILDRIILIRVLETEGLHPYYSLVRQYVHWTENIRNYDIFPFFKEVLMRTFSDIEKDLNTDLFKDSLMEQVRTRLTDVEGQPLTFLTIPNKYARALVDPDVYWTDQDQDIRELIGQQTGQQRYAYSTPYNYDFHTLTQDIVGQVYEQFLAHSLVEQENRILIRTDQFLRQQEGAYYTPMPVVHFIVEGTLGHLIRSIQDETEQHLRRKRYQDAQKTIDRLQTIKVLDLACGSGTFLIAAYQMLVKIYRWWNERLNQVRAEDFEQDWIAFLTSGLKMENNPGDAVLHHCIFGIDRDSQAVEMAKLNLWLLLLRTQPEDYSRRGEKPPKSKLPDLSTNVIAADALFPPPDIDMLLGSGSQLRIILGNPPWGANLKSYGSHLGDFVLARGQFDSYDLFIERATRCLRPGDLLGYVVPDSILQPPEHTRLRDHILRHYQMDALVKLGEGIFEDVFRGSVAFQFTRSDSIASDHKVCCRIVVKEERSQVLKSPRENTLQSLLDREGSSITQARFQRNKDKVFDIFTSDEDAAILQVIDRDTLSWQNTFVTGRGVEVSKTGAVMACSHCGIWQNIPRKQKNGAYADVICINPKCGQIIHYHKATQASIISPHPTLQCVQPIIVGEGINRYQTVEVRYLDTSRVMIVPGSPKADSQNPKKPLGINYKSPELYAGEKLLVRKTGRGIYATIDRTGAYTNQVVFIFKLKPELSPQHSQLRLGYILGVLNSRMMLYRYYKVLGDIEWKSFPYMTQDTIMGLPIRHIDFNDARQSYLHTRIADLVDTVISSGKAPDAATDSEIESFVRELYGVDTPVMSSRIDSELERIGRLGSLLGSSSESQEALEAAEE